MLVATVDVSLDTVTFTLLGTLLPVPVPVTPSRFRVTPLMASLTVLLALVYGTPATLKLASLAAAACV